jgi:WD40 repeat protein
VAVNELVNFVLQDKVAAVASGRAIDIWSTSSNRELNPTGSKNQGNCTVLTRWNGEFLAAASPLGILGSDANLAFFCGIPFNTQSTSVKFLPDGSVVAVSARNSTIEVWDAASGQKRTIISKAPGNMLDVAISGDGSLLAASSVSGVIEIYDRLTLELLKILDTSTSPVNQVTFTSNQKYIITGSEDGTVRMWGLVP